VRIRNKIISDPGPGGPGSDMNTKLHQFTISQKNAQKNLIFQKENSPKNLHIYIHCTKANWNLVVISGINCEFAQFMQDLKQDPETK
jgi:hypothetical protein